MIRLPAIVLKNDDGTYTAEALSIDCDDGEGATKDAALTDLKANIKEFLEEVEGTLEEVLL